MNLNSNIKSVLIYSSIACGIVSCKQKPHYAYPVKEFDPNSISEYIVNGTKTDRNGKDFSEISLLLFDWQGNLEKTSN